MSPTKLLHARRAVLQGGGGLLGGAALSALLGDDAHAAPAARGRLSPGGPRPHFKPRAKSVIFIHMVGAPSQLDLFDNKPELARRHGKPIPEEFIKGQRFAFLRGHPNIMGSPYKFARHGQSGIEVSELLPHTATVVDDLTIIKSLHTEQFNHSPAQLFFQTGFGRFGRPCLGSWALYGLGSENKNVPGFVVLVSGSVAGAGNSLWGSGFLPTAYQGVRLRSEGDPVLFLSNPAGVSRPDRRRVIDSVNHLNRLALADVGDPEIATRIGQYELAFRMQAAVPALMDIKREPRAIHEMYGTELGKESFANNCLLARRLVESGVRFVQIYDADWDHHADIAKRLPDKCKETDRASAALVRDLKQRGLLDDTLVVWAGEFGRTPMTEPDNRKGPGRDHHKDAFTVWMAGGGLRRGISYGATDELGYHITQNPMHVNDFHATILHLLGLDHEKLTFKFQGRPYRLTDVAGKVAHKIIA